MEIIRKKLGLFSRLCIQTAHGSGIHGLSTRGFADDRGTQPTLSQQFHQRLRVWTEHLIRKGQVLFLTATGVFNL